MAGPRIVAELGRPETAQETADRKAASSAAYRSSKTFRNLAAALLITVAVVAVVYFGVPRGSLREPDPVDVSAVADQVSSSIDHTLLVPTVPAEWRANAARLEGETWLVVYAPPKGFVNIAQGIGVADGWAPRRLGNVSPSGSVTIDGIAWDEYTMSGQARPDGISYALSTIAGANTVLVYGGSLAPETVRTAAEGLTDQIRTLREETP